jgi:uncharacterized repeat protein (TIGR02543 family)
LNDDGSIIDVTVVEHGKVPFYVAPQKPSTAEYSYEFAGWLPAITAATCDMTYKASYSAIKKEYTVVWNVDGVKTSENYEYGTLPEFKGSVYKAADGCTSYNFIGWNKSITPVSGNTEYTALFSIVAKHISNDFTYQNNTDGTHTVKYKCCSEFISVDSCLDAPFDGNHKCDLCYADNIGLHSGGEASCKTLAICSDCGSLYGGYDKYNHESSESIYSDITDFSHDVFYACCGALMADNVLHDFTNRVCICQATKQISVIFMNSNYVWEILDCDENGVLNIEYLSNPAAQKGYIFAGWYTAEGTCVGNKLNLTDDLVLYARFVPGDVDGSGKIDQHDADILNRFIVGESVRVVDDQSALDVNSDGRITVLDSVAILLYISGNPILIK